MSRGYWDLGPERDTQVAVALGEQPADLVIRGGRLVDVHTGEIYATDVAVSGSRIATVGEVERCIGDDTTLVDGTGRYLVPGFIDTHFHIGASALAMTQLARLLVPLGTAAIVTDFYEPSITNGIDAIRFLLDETAQMPLRTYLSPFCPAYSDDENVSVVTPAEFETLLEWPECLEVREWYVAREFRGNLEERAIGSKARSSGLRLAGHLAHTDGALLQAAAAMGVASDHEMATTEETIARLRLGIAAQLRWSSGARNELPALLKAISERRCDSRLIMFSTDEEDVDEFAELGHIDHRLRLAVSQGIAPLDAIRMGSLNAAVFLGIAADLGSIAPGRLAFVNLVDDLASFHVSTVVAGARVVGSEGAYVGPTPEAVTYPASFSDTIKVGRTLSPGDFAIPSDNGIGSVTVRVIGLAPNGHGWEERTLDLPAADGVVVSDAVRDVAKVAVVERYRSSGKVGVGLLQGFGVTHGAFGTSFYPVGMNIGVVGVDDEDMAIVANRIAQLGGGYVAVLDGEVIAEVALPLLGYLSAEPAEGVVTGFRAVREAIAQRLGCTIPGLYTTFGYLLLPVSPGLHIGIDGLVRVDYSERGTRTIVPVVVE